MAHANPPLEQIRQILTDAKTIAVVGASSRENRPSYGVFRRLQAAGFRVIPVNPHEKEVLGEPAYNTLDEVPEPIDIVDVFRRAEDTPPIADDAVRVGAKVLWLQQGIINEEAARRAEAGGLTVVMDLCTATSVAILQVPRKTSQEKKN
jgi:uncharacterized protein